MKQTVVVMTSAAALFSAVALHAEESMGHSMHEEELFTKVMIDRLERREAEPDGFSYWEGQAWFGGDTDKLWLKSDGHVVKGETEEGALEGYYSRAIAPFWDLQIGARHDFALHGEPSRNWAAIGFKGLAPYKFEIDTTLYAGAEGRTALRAKAEYDLLIAQHLILMPEVETSLYGKTDTARGIGKGLANLDLGLRLRYELRREFAPYVGVNWSGKYGATADLARAAGNPVRDSQWLVGVRAWW